MPIKYILTTDEPDAEIYVTFKLPQTNVPCSNQVKRKCISDSPKSKKKKAKTKYIAPEKQDGGGTDFEISMFSAPTDITKLGPLATKYLNRDRDFPFGIHYDKKSNGYMVGHKVVDFDGDDIIINFGDKKMRYTGTEGLWRLLTQDRSYFDMQNYYTWEDWVISMEILLRANIVTDPSEVQKIGEKRCLGIGIGGNIGNKISEVTTFCILNPLGGGVLNTIGAGINQAINLGLQAHDMKNKVIGTVGAGVLTVVGTGVVNTINLGNKVLNILGQTIYGDLGNMGDSIYEKVDKVVKDNPGAEDSKQWDSLKCPACIHLKDLDELIRRLINLQNIKLAQKLYCRFTQSCLLFWFTQRLVATMGKEGGMDKLIDWAKINDELIKESDLVKKMIDNLPFGFNHINSPICFPNEGAASKGNTDTSCVEHDERYQRYLQGNPELEAEVKIGMRVLQELFNSDGKFFETLDIFGSISPIDLNMALEMILAFLQSYYSTS